MTAIRNFFRKVSYGGLVILTALLPLKFGLMLLPGNATGTPADVFAWVINGWPPALFVLISGALLALTLTGYGIPDALNLRRGGGLLLSLWLLAIPVAAVGWLDASSMEAPVTEMQYLLGLAAFAGVVHVMLAAEGKALAGRLLTAVTIGTLLTTAIGIHQVFWGFDEMNRFVAMQEKIYHIQFPADFKARVFDRRAYSTFTFASALAGCLALTGMAAIVKLYQWGNRLEPVKLSRRLFALLGILAMGGVFLATKGRGAFLAVIAAAAITGLLLIAKRKFQIVILLAALLAVAIGAWGIQHAGRGFGSMAERVGYLRTTAIMLAEHPLTGDGWGDFTNAHARLKNFGNEEMARDPHNVLAAFTGACGIAGLIWGLAFLLIPWYLGYRTMNRTRSAIHVALFFGLTAFVLHALMDLDWQVPGLMGLWIVMQALLLPEENVSAAGRNKVPRTVLLWTVSFAALAAGLWMTECDNRLNALTEAAGQAPGATTAPVSAYEVRQLGTAALQLMPWSHSVYMILGRDALHRGNASQAEKDFRAAWERAPEYQPIYRALADAYALGGNPEKAAEFDCEADARFPHYQEFMKSHPEKRPAGRRRNRE